MKSLHSYRGSPEATQVAPASRVMSQRCQVSRAPRLRKFCQILFSLDTDSVLFCLDNAHRLCFGFNTISFVILIFSGTTVAVFL